MAVVSGVAEYTCDGTEEDARGDIGVAAVCPGSGTCGTMATDLAFGGAFALGGATV